MEKTTMNVQELACIKTAGGISTSDPADRFRIWCVWGMGFQRTDTNRNGCRQREGRASLQRVWESCHASL